MIKMGIVIETRGWPAATKRDHARVRREVLEMQALEWHGRMLPRHFKTGARARYGYQKRSAAYMRRKRWEKGHQRDLVWSGVMQREATSRVTVRATPKRATAAFHARAVNLSGRASKRRQGFPDFRTEMTGVTQQEIDKLARKGARYAERRLSKIRRRRRRSIA